MTLDTGILRRMIWPPQTVTCPAQRSILVARDAMADLASYA
jgi:hypothetical protein